MGGWSKAWMNHVNWVEKKGPTGLLKLPLQLANCDRLEHNDAVYIFDEVGVGKTVVSGLMAVHYLYNHPGQRVLVITTATLAKGENGSRGSFLDDWYNRLPIDELGLTNRITVVSNHCSKFNSDGRDSVSTKDYGLIIIDEAQVFLNKKTDRYLNLTGTTGNFLHRFLNESYYTLTERVVFLTATPIKEELSNMETYRTIAMCLLRKPFLKDSSADESNRRALFDQTIEGAFSQCFPATRYFKDVIEFSGQKGDAEYSPKREFHLWTWDAQNSEKEDEEKNKALLSEMCGAWKADKENGIDSRFLIFVRYVANEAYNVYDYLSKHSGGAMFDKDGEAIKVITGDNSGELSQYEGKKGGNLPRVLILTYQIAEAGVNLPGFNYVINYHIPAHPSALEQRFGRIDRMTSERPVIHACYMLRKAVKEELLAKKDIYLKPGCEMRNEFWPDTNTVNFCKAIGTYLNGLLPYLPSRNALLNKEIFDRYKELLGPSKTQLKELERQLNKFGIEDGEFEAYLSHISNPKAAVPAEYRRLFNFCDDYLPQGKGTESKKNLESAIKTKVAELKEDISREIYMDEKDLLKLLENQDRVYYKKGKNGKLESTEMRECIEKTVWNDVYRQWLGTCGKDSEGSEQPRGARIADTCPDAVKCHDIALSRLRAEIDNIRSERPVGVVFDKVIDDYAAFIDGIYSENIKELYRIAALNVFYDCDFHNRYGEAGKFLRDKYREYLGDIEPKPDEALIRLARNAAAFPLYRSAWYELLERSASMDDCANLMGIPRGKMRELYTEVGNKVISELWGQFDVGQQNLDCLSKNDPFNRAYRYMETYMKDRMESWEKGYYSELIRRFTAVAETIKQHRTDCEEAEQNYNYAKYYVSNCRPDGPNRDLTEICKASLKRVFRATIKRICEANFFSGAHRLYLLSSLDSYMPEETRKLAIETGEALSKFYSETLDEVFAEQEKSL